jgi:hypothetical protein
MATKMTRAGSRGGRRGRNFARGTSLHCSVDCCTRSGFSRILPNRKRGLKLTPDFLLDRPNSQRQVPASGGMEQSEGQSFLSRGAANMMPSGLDR